MKKLIGLLGILLCLSLCSIAKVNQFYYYLCRTVLDNGGGGYGTVTKQVDNHYDIYGVLIGQDVTIFCAADGDKTCPKTLANPGGGDEIDDLPSNVSLYCEGLFEDLCDGANNEIFPITRSVLGSDGIVYYISATLIQIEGGIKYNLLITANLC